MTQNAIGKRQILLGKVKECERSKLRGGPSWCPPCLFYISTLNPLSLHHADCVLFAKAGRPQLTNQDAGKTKGEAGAPRITNIGSKSKVISEDDRRWCDTSALIQFLGVPADLRFLSCCLYLSRIARRPLWMQIKNMAWDPFWNFIH